MRLVDEITERPTVRPLPAPTGPRMPTSQVPVTVPVAAASNGTVADVAPPLDVPVLPYLPPVAVKTTEPATTPAPVTAATLALAAGITLASTTPEESVKAKRGHKKLRIAVATLVALVLTTTLVGVIFRNSALVERFTGKGYDTNPLPTHAQSRPVFTGAIYTLSTQSVAMSEGLPKNFWRTERDEVNYTSRTAKLKVDLASASIIGNKIGTPQSTAPSYEMIVDETTLYEPGAATTDPWIRTKNDPGWWGALLLTGDEVRMYQDVFDPALRAAQPASVVDEVHNDVPVTTYTYTLDFGDFYESAPRLFDFVKFLDGNAPDDATVTVTISLDKEYLVRYLEVNLDYEAVLDYRARNDLETRYPYHFVLDVLSTTNSPAAVDVPANAVDAPPEESTTTTIAPVAVP